MMQMKWIILFGQCFILFTAETGSSSLQFLSTGRVQPGNGPVFEQLTVFDGDPISYCDSMTTQEKLKPTLQSKNLPEHCGEAHTNMLESLHEIPQFINSTVYVLQRRRGCIQSADGIVSAFERWAVNGMDFLSFDPESQRWMSHSPSAITVKQRWDNNKARNVAFEHFMRQQCPQMIQGIKLRSIQQHTELNIFAKTTANTTEALLRCHVVSTDKSVSSVHLIGDGASKVHRISITGPVPSEDGSVILRLTAGIVLGQNTYTYGCSVLTGGHKITVFWDGNTLDGRQLLNQFSGGYWSIWIGITILLLIVSVFLLLYRITVYLYQQVKQRARHASGVDQRLLEQFTGIIESVASPDLQSVIVSYTPGTERNGEWDQWMVKITLRQQDFYDTDYFAHQIDGP